MVRAKHMIQLIADKNYRQTFSKSHSISRTLFVPINGNTDWFRNHTCVSLVKNDKNLCTYSYINQHTYIYVYEFKYSIEFLIRIKLNLDSYVQLSVGRKTAFVYVYIYTNIFMCLYINIFLYLHVYTFMYLYNYLFAYLNIYLFKHILYILTCIYPYRNVLT